MSTELIDASTAAEIAGVQTRTIWHYNRYGRMPKPVTYFGRSPVWDKTDIEKWVTEKNARSTRPTANQEGSTPNE